MTERTPAPICDSSSQAAVASPPNRSLAPHNTASHRSAGLRSCATDHQRTTVYDLLQQHQGETLSEDLDVELIAKHGRTGWEGRGIGSYS